MEKDPARPRRFTWKRLVAIAAILTAFVGTTAGACDDDADVASENISKDADNFKIMRRIIFINTVDPSRPLLVIEGKCAIEDQGNQLEVTCKRANNEFVKNFLGLQSGHVTYLVEQMDAVNVSVDHYKRSFKPEAWLPDIEKR